MKQIFLVALLGFFAINLSAQKGMRTIFAEQIFTDMHGNETSLGEILKDNEGKVIYIDFWASWCGPCKQAMPASKALHKELKDDDIVFLYLSIDSKQEPWLKSIDKLDIIDEGMHFRRNQEDAVELLKFFYIRSIPHYMIVGKDGQVVNRDALPPTDPNIKRQLKKWSKG